MTPDELRALAYALDDEDFEFRDSPMQVRRKWADYLRAQADAQPVATLTLLDDIGAQIDFHQSFTLLPGQTFSLYTHPAPAVPAGYKLVPVEPTPEMIDAGCDVDARAEVVSKFAAKPGVHDPEAWVSAGELLSVQYRAMLAAAPSAPQAEQEKANGNR